MCRNSVDFCILVLYIENLLDLIPIVFLNSFQYSKNSIIYLQILEVLFSFFPNIHFISCYYLIWEILGHYLFKYLVSFFPPILMEVYIRPFNHISCSYALFIFSIFIFSSFDLEAEYFILTFLFFSS